MSDNTPGHCPGCGAANPAGARFCGACGASLLPAKSCPACGAGNPAGQAYCNSCGSPFRDVPAPEDPPPATARTGMDGERKQVTVLFADVKGSMELAEGIDPEEWREIMQRFFSLLSEGVHRFEGTVDKFTGDGIMALFGAPVTHEDHAARACFAALHIGELVAGYAAELRREKGLSFSVRIGINSGEVVAGSFGEGEELEYTAVGHTVGLAQRMETLAEPGKVYLTERTAKLAGGYLELKDLGEFDVKGASRPIGVFELVGVGPARSRLDLSRDRGLSRFVGRSEEMAVLEDALEQAGEGRGAVIGVVAEAGVGKSRLCYEFVEHCRSRGIDVYEAQARAHGEAMPFMPVLEMLRGYFGIKGRDSEQVAREKIAGRLLLLDPGFSDDLPLIFDFLAVPDPDRPPPQVSAEARRRMLRRVIRRISRAPGRSKLVVNLIEDLHWMDEGSEELMAEMVSAAEGTATLVVLNFRPEYQDDWLESKVYRRLSLVPFGLDSTRELLADLAGDDRSLDGLAELIHERTGGNPFFIEEVVRELDEAGNLEGERGAYRLSRPIDETGVPATVQVILAARIDRLGDPKSLLQVAAVIGNEVPEETLRKVSGLDDDILATRLEVLIAGGFLQEAAIYPERVFAFTHPLTREVAYGSQLGEQRAAAHAATAKALIELSPDRHDEMAALIAQHLERAGELREAARWSARAAHWSGHSHPHDALRLWTKVSELASALPEDEETLALGVISRLLQLDYAWRLGMKRDRVDVLAAEVREIAMRSGDLRSQALLKHLESARPGLDIAVADWTAAVREANDLADQSGDRDLRVTMRSLAAYSYLCAADLDVTEHLLDEALELAGGDRGAGAGIVIGCPFAWCLMAKGVIRRERGQFDDADELFESALKVAGSHGDPETQSWTRGQQATLYVVRGEPDAALRLARRNFEITEQLGDVFSRHYALLNLGQVYGGLARYEEAFEYIGRAERLYREAMESGGEWEVWREAGLADALRGLDRIPEALHRAERGIEVGRERGLNWSLVPALKVAAEVRAAAGEPGVRELLDEAEGLASACGLTVELEEVRLARNSALILGGS